LVETRTSLGEKRREGLKPGLKGHSCGDLGLETNVEEPMLSRRYVKTGLKKQIGETVQPEKEMWNGRN